MKRFNQFVDEDAPANAAGTGGVAGIGIGPKGEPGVELRKRKKQIEDMAADAHLDDIKEDRETFAGAPVFEVDMDRIMNVKGPKHPRHRYSRYVGTDEMGEIIRQHGRANRGDIVIKDQATAVMTYLRRKSVR